MHSSASLICLNEKPLSKTSTVLGASYA
jgi:hypothetical protein